MNMASLNMTDANRFSIADTLGKVLEPRSNDNEPEETDMSHSDEDDDDTSPPPTRPPTLPPPTLPPTTAPPTPMNPFNSLINTQNSAAKNANNGRPGIVMISGIVVGCALVIAAVVFIVRKRGLLSTDRRRGKSLSTPDDRTQQSTRYANGTILDDTTANYSHLPDTNDLHVLPLAPRPKLEHSSSSMSDDPDIIALRIPMEKVVMGQLLSRGGFGEVYRGTYKGEAVAIKRLLPERRKDLRQIDAFLSEAKLMGALEHERIVRFIGVAWDSLAEVCVVSEYMEGGDLRTVLAGFEQERRLHGFDHDKIKIALHVAHAMTYLHSLQPIVLHRDLKSKNILLSADYDAKITDFGVSRERIDATMTAGVGSSLWMAPEVMMGERYDEKADVFSFGVVLSELDTHLHPYSHATEPGTGRKLPDTAILQMVTLGRLTVEFTASADPDLVALGRDCVAVDPAQRPTAGQVLHRVHQVWRSCVSL